MINTNIGNFLKVTIFGCLMSLGVQAKVFPLRQGNLEVIYLEDPRVDFALRLEAIKRAKKSIRAFTYFHTVDPIGMIFIEALRDAMKRGVKVEFLFESSLSRLSGDPLNKTTALLADSNLKSPAQVIATRVREKKKAGLSISDYEHQKLLLIDAETDEEVAFIGGRPYNKFADQSLDTSFMLRAIDPKAPNLLQDIRESSQETWDLMKSVFTLENLRPIKTSPTKSASFQILETEQQRQLASELIAVLEKPPHTAAGLHPLQFRPSEAQWITNDLFQNLLRDPKIGSSISSRQHRITNDISEYIARKISAAKRLDVHSYAIALPPVIKNSVRELLERNGSVRLITNGQSAHRLLFPGGLPIYFTLDETKDLLTHPNAHLVLYQPPQRFQGPRYLHSKLMLLDDDRLITGSDNFTLSSAFKNSESSLYLRDAGIIALLRSSQALRPHFELMKPAQITHLLRSKPIIANCLMPLMRIYY